MREILFRGQTRRKGQKVWMDGTPVDSNWVEGYGVCMGKGDFSIIYSGDHVEKFPVYTDTVGQFTGLTDKNGVKIFEGDIFLIRGMEPSVNGLYTVKFSEANHCWWLRNPNPLDHSFSFSDLNGFHEDGEVVGNIHDNPELLEVTE